MNTNKLALDALDKLARLGNGDCIGNSTGNTIAAQAASEIRAFLESVQVEPVALTPGERVFNKIMAQRPKKTPQQAAPGWQPIETAPKDQTPVDLWRGERLVNMRRIALTPDNIFYEPVVSGYSCVRDATHWMPIPTAPKAPV